MPATSTYEPEYLSWLTISTGVVAGVLILPSLLLSVADRDKPLNFSKLTRWQFAKIFVLTSWVVLPPIWFWTEYLFIFKRRRKQTLDPSVVEPFDDFKYRQDQSAKIWLALISALFVLYFGKDLGSKPPGTPGSSLN